MHIVLHEPEIPGNTGNIGRSCAATNTSLHLIEPLGFEITEKELRRAGLDYWAQLDVHRYRDYEDFMLENFGADRLCSRCQPPSASVVCHDQG